MRLIAQILSITICLALMLGCKIKIQTPPEGFVVAAEGGLVCGADKTCTISVTDLAFDVEMVAIPWADYEFNGWEVRHRGLCGGSTKPCHLTTSGFGGNRSLEALLASDEEFYLNPTFVERARPKDIKTTVMVPEVALLDTEQTIFFSARNVSSTPKKIRSMEIWVLVDDYGHYETVADNWHVESEFGDCRFEHADIQSAKFSSRGTRFTCSDLPAVDPGETLEFSLKITPETLAEHQIYVGLPDGLHLELTVTPSLIDSDSDGAIDLEEELSGSDPFNAQSQPSMSVIELLLFYTPEFARHYHLEEERTGFFTGFIDYANQVFRNSGVRIELELVDAVASGEAYTDSEQFSSYISDAAHRRNGFEALTELEKKHSIDIVGVIDGGETFERGRADGISSGSPRAYFSAIDDYQVMLHEIGHNLGANHDYGNLDIQFEPRLRSRLGTYNFSYGYVEGDEGSIMSYAPNAKPFFSNPLVRNCGLSLCGVAGQNPESAANNALTLNLRRHFMSNTKNFDEDYDGMPEWWEQKYFVDSVFNRCKDLDGDGAANIEEFMAHSDPSDRASRPESRAYWLFCKPPLERTAVFYANRNERIQLDLRTIDPYGHFLQVDPATDPKHGSIGWYTFGLGIYYYQPKNGFEGTDSMEFLIRNGLAGDAAFTVTVEVGNSE